MNFKNKKTLKEMRMIERRGKSADEEERRGRKGEK